MAQEWSHDERVREALDAVIEVCDSFEEAWWPTTEPERRSILSRALFQAWRRQVDESALEALLLSRPETP